MSGRGSERDSARGSGRVRAPRRQRRRFRLGVPRRLFHGIGCWRGGARSGAGAGAGSGCSGHILPSFDRHGARQRFGLAPSAVAAASRRAPARGAHDIGFDHDVARAADHQQMLDIVAADQDQPAASVDGRGIDHREAGLAAARRRRAQPLGAEAAHQEGGHADQGEHDDECEEESHRERHVRAK